MNPEETDNKRIRLILIVEKARREYHSFLSVRTLGDIARSLRLTKTLLRLENNLFKSHKKIELLYILCVYRSDRDIYQSY